MKENESKKIQQKASSPFSLLKVLSHHRENENFFYSLPRRDSKALFLVFVYVSSLLFSLKLSRF